MARQRAGLGRGLNALIGVDPSASDELKKAETSASQKTSKATATKSAPHKEEKQAESASNNQEIDINLVIANPDQPRLNFNEEELRELADSIKKNGLLQPILVRKVGALYQIIAGERRWQACKMIGLKKVPVRITEADDIQSVALAMIENIQRSNLNPMEEAFGYQMLMDRNGMTQAELADAVSKGRSTIANTLRLLDLPEDAQQLLYEGKITAGHARAILSIPTAEGRQQLTNRLVEESLSVREAERLANLIAGKKAAKTPRIPAPAQYKRVARGLKEALGTDVRVKTSKGKNKIEIDFKDEAQLEELFRKIVSEN